MYEKLEKEQAELRAMSAGDPSLLSMAEADIKSLEEQKQGLLKQMEEIVTSEEAVVSELPNEIILEVGACYNVSQICRKSWLVF